MFSDRSKHTNCKTIEIENVWTPIDRSTCLGKKFQLLLLLCLFLYICNQLQLFPFLLNQTIPNRTLVETGGQTTYAHSSKRLFVELNNHLNFFTTKNCFRKFNVICTVFTGGSSRSICSHKPHTGISTKRWTSKRARPLCSIDGSEMIPRRLFRTQYNFRANEIVRDRERARSRVWRKRLLRLVLVPRVNGWLMVLKVPRQTETDENRPQFGVALLRWGRYHDVNGVVDISVLPQFINCSLNAELLREELLRHVK